MLDACKRRSCTLVLVWLLHGSFIVHPADAQLDEFFTDARADDESSQTAWGLLVDLTVLDELKLNKAQRDGIQRILDSHTQQVDDLKQDYKDRLSAVEPIGEQLRKRAQFRAEIRRKTEELEQSAKTSVLAILTPSQQASLQEKLGDQPIADQTVRPNISATPNPKIANSRAPAVRSADAVATFSSSPPNDENNSGIARTPAGTKLSFNFHTAPWTDVLRLFADSAGLTLNLKDTPPGTFSYFDKQEYSPTQALDIMNRFLLQEGYILIKHDRFLTVLNVEKGIPPNLVETVMPEELSARGSTEYVRVALPLGDREAVKAAEEIEALLGPQGTVAPLESAGSVVVSDIAANLLRVKQLLEPPPKVPAAETVFRAFPLTRIDAPTAADIIRSLFGLQPGVQNVSAAADDSSSRRRSGSRSGFDPREYFRSRFGSRGGDDGDDWDRRSRGSGSDSSPTSQAKAKVAIDPRTNSILVTATAADMKIVEGIIEAIDVNPSEVNGLAALPKVSDPYLEVYELKTADAQEVAKTLGVLHPGMVINEDGRNRRIHIWATATQQREISAHIRQLDGAASGDVLAVLPLGTLNPYDVTVTLTSLFAGESSGAPSVQIDPTGRGIIVKGNVVQISQIRMLVEQMAAHGSSASERTVRVVPNGGQSSFVQQAIGALYPQVTISTTAAPVATSGSTEENDRSRRTRQRGSESVDEERAERIRRFMEMRDRFWGSSADPDGGRNRDRDSERGRDRGRSRDE